VIGNNSDKVVDFRYYKKYCRQDINEETLPSMTYNVLSEPVDAKSMFSSVFDGRGAGLPVLDKGGADMDWQEKYIDKVDQEISGIKSEIRDSENRIGNRIDSKLEEFRSEMRHLDNQRVEDMREIRTHLADNLRHVRSMSQATTIGVASMVVAVILGVAGIWWTVWSSQQSIINLLQQIPK
jgi:hypothetical protein